MKQVGLKLAEDVKVVIGEIREELFEELKKSTLDYSVAFDKVNKNGVKETIITLRNPDIEISLNNDIVEYIKTVNTEYSKLDEIKHLGDNSVEHIQKITGNLVKYFEVEAKDIILENIDITNMSITAIIKYDTTSKIRVHVLRDAFGNIFINTIAAL